MTVLAAAPGGRLMTTLEFLFALACHAETFLAPTRQRPRALESRMCREFRQRRNDWSRIRDGRFRKIATYQMPIPIAPYISSGRRPV